MAVGKKKSAKSGGSRKARLSLFKNDRFKFIMGVLVVLLTAYVMIAFISFLFYGAADQSVIELNWRELFYRSREIDIQNWAGKPGAWLAETIINNGFGISSFIFLYLLTLTGLRFWDIKPVHFGKNLVYSLILIIWLSVSLGFVLGEPENGHFLYWGGRYGFFLSSWVASFIGKIGLVFLILFTGITLMVIRFENAHLFFRNLLRVKVREPRKNEENTEEDTDVLTDDSFTKVIEDDDTVKINFDPDDLKNDDDDFRFADEEESEQLAGDADEDDITLTVKKKVEEEEALDEEFEGEQLEEYDPTLDLSDYKFPTIDLLDDHKSGNAEVTNEELISNKNKIVETLRHYKIEITKIRATIGPTITLYEIVPAPGIRIAKIKNLEDDIALSLSAMGIRIIAPIPGRGTIGIEVPNQQPEIVSMRSIISSKKFQETTAELPIALGKTISNETYMFDLVKMPHILVAGATGQGKSVGVNVIITSLLYKKHPSQLKFVFIDPKKVELNLYSVIEKHYLAKLPDEEEPVITDIQKVKNTLNSINVEMDQRYDLLKKAHARNVKEYNKKFISRKLNPMKGHKYMPYIVVIIDEFADLIMTAGKEIELPIARIAQLARAVGIHMIIATQRPSVTIITGVIKANFPARIAFKVASMIDSRTIIDQPGANQLIGKGDMLISVGSEIERVQCAFVDTAEVERICAFIAGQRGYPTAFLLPEYMDDEETGPGQVDLNNKDEMFEEAARVVVMNQMGSTSMIQRKFSIGYNRAGRIMDQLEAAGIVGPSEGSKARQVLIQDEYTLEKLLNDLN